MGLSVRMTTFEKGNPYIFTIQENIYTSPTMATTKKQHWEVIPQPWKNCLAALELIQRDSASDITEPGEAFIPRITQDFEDPSGRGIEDAAEVCDIIYFTALHALSTRPFQVVHFEKARNFFPEEFPRGKKEILSALSTLSETVLKLSDEARCKIRPLIPRFDPQRTYDPPLTEMMERLSFHCEVTNRIVQAFLSFAVKPHDGRKVLVKLLSKEFHMDASLLGSLSDEGLDLLFKESEQFGELVSGLYKALHDGGLLRMKQFRSEGASDDEGQDVEEGNLYDAFKDTIKAICSFGGPRLNPRYRFVVPREKFTSVEIDCWMEYYALLVGLLSTLPGANGTTTQKERNLVLEEFFERRISADRGIEALLYEIAYGVDPPVVVFKETYYPGDLENGGCPGVVPYRNAQDESAKDHLTEILARPTFDSLCDFGNVLGFIRGKYAPCEKDFAQRLLLGMDSSERERWRRLLGEEMTYLAKNLSSIAGRYLPKRESDAREKEIKKLYNSDRKIENSLENAFLDKKAELDIQTVRYFYVHPHSFIKNCYLLPPVDMEWVEKKVCEFIRNDDDLRGWIRDLSGTDSTRDTGTTDAAPVKSSPQKGILGEEYIETLRQIGIKSGYVSKKPGEDGGTYYIVNNVTQFGMFLVRNHFVYPRMTQEGCQTWDSEKSKEKWLEQYEEPRKHGITYNYGGASVLKLIEELHKVAHHRRDPLPTEGSRRYEELKSAVFEIWGTISWNTLDGIFFEMTSKGPRVLEGKKFRQAAQDWSRKNDFRGKDLARVLEGIYLEAKDRHEEKERYSKAAISEQMTG